MASPVNKDSYKQIKKLAHFESDARYFDALLADLQRDHEERLYIDEYILNIYSSARWSERPFIDFFKESGRLR
jgi:hypothetical protein